jgi:hypothetical protein
VYLEPIMSFARAHDSFRAVKLFFYILSIGSHDKQNILNLELALFYLKPTLSNGTIVNYRLFFSDIVICTQVLTSDCMLHSNDVMALIIVYYANKTVMSHLKIINASCTCVHQFQL